MREFVKAAAVSLWTLFCCWLLVGQEKPPEPVIEQQRQPLFYEPASAWIKEPAAHSDRLWTEPGKTAPQWIQVDRLSDGMPLYIGTVGIGGAVGIVTADGRAAGSASLPVDVLCAHQ